MPRRLTLCVAALGAAVLLQIPTPALALEPMTVTTEGIVAASGPAEAPPRDAAFRAALVAAVFEVARMLVPPERFEQDAERLHAQLGPQAQSFVLTYRVDGALSRRSSALDPEIEEWVLPVTARIDAVQLRSFLVRSGFLREAGERPSLVIRVRAVGELAEATPIGALSQLGRNLRANLEQQEFVLVEAALRPDDGSEPRSALELARGVGADVGVELEVDWRPSPQSDGVVGGVAEVRARALRSVDGNELAIARFEAAGYHAERDEAIARALEALEPQLAANLGLQLQRNWQAHTPGERPVEIELEAVSGLGQVNAVQRALVGMLAARSAEIRSLQPGGATLRVVSSLSAGALLERLASLHFEGFALLPVEAGAGRARLRLEVAPGASERLTPAPGKIDAQDRN